MRILWNSIWLMVLPFVMWQQGTYEKYPELVLPLFLIWIAILAPHFEIPDWHWKWRRLERYKDVAIDAGDNDLLIKIGDEFDWVKEWNSPATVGSVKLLLGKYDAEIGSLRRMTEIENRVAELKRGSKNSVSKSLPINPTPDACFFSAC